MLPSQGTAGSLLEVSKAGWSSGQPGVVEGGRGWHGMVSQVLSKPWCDAGARSSVILGLSLLLFPWGLKAAVGWLCAGFGVSPGTVGLPETGEPGHKTLLIPSR